VPIEQQHLAPFMVEPGITGPFLIDGSDQALPGDLQTHSGLGGSPCAFEHVVQVFPCSIREIQHLVLLVDRIWP